MKSVLTLLAKSALIPFRPGMSAADAAIHKKIYRSGTTELIIQNEEIGDIMKTVKSLKESELLIKGISQKIKSKAKEQKVGFLSILLGTLDASILGNAIVGKRVIKADDKVQSRIIL